MNVKHKSIPVYALVWLMRVIFVICIVLIPLIIWSVVQIDWGEKSQ